MKRVLVIGNGLIGARHATLVQQHPDCTLIGVVEPNTDLHRDADVRYFINLAEVTADVDGAIIAHRRTFTAAMVLMRRSGAGIS